MDLVVALVLQRFEEAHMTINFSRGKTEMIAVYRGTGATAHQREDVIAHKGLIKLTEKQIDVVAVARYKHLGSIIQGDAEMDSEVWARIGAASKALRLLRKGAFRIRGLSLQCRLGLLDALVFSRLFYNVGTWVTLHRPAWKRPCTNVTIEQFVQQFVSQLLMYRQKPMAMHYAKQACRTWQVNFAYVAYSTWDIWLVQGLRNY